MPPYSRSTLKRKYGSTNYVAKRRKTTVYRTVKGEIKAKDTAASGTDFSSAGAVVLLNGISQGSDIFERDGRQISLHSLKGQLLLSPNLTQDLGAYVLYFIYDMAPNGATPAITDIFVAASNVTVPRQDNAWRFKVMKTVMYNPAYQTVTTLPIVDSPTKYFNMTLSLAGKKTHYINTGNTITSIGQGAVYMVAIGANSLCDYTYSFSLKYTE